MTIFSHNSLYSQENSSLSATFIENLNQMYIWIKANQIICGFHYTDWPIFSYLQTLDFPCQYFHMNQISILKYIWKKIYDVYFGGMLADAIYLFIFLFVTYSSHSDIMFTKIKEFPNYKNLGHSQYLDYLQLKKLRKIIFLSNQRKYFFIVCVSNSLIFSLLTLKIKYHLHK